MIFHGIAEWESIEGADDKLVPLYRGSVLPEDILLNQALQEQTNIRETTDYFTCVTMH